MNSRRLSAVSLVLIALSLLGSSSAGAETPEDTKAPQLVGLTIEPDEVDTTAADQKVTFTAHVTDDLAGISSVGIAIASPSESQVVVESLNFSSGTSTDALYSGSVTIPRFAEAGAWRVTNVYLNDSARNGDALSTAELEGLGLPSTVQVDPPPTVVEIQPVSGPESGGTAVEILGTGLGSTTAVRFGTETASFIVSSPTSITAIAPPGIGNVDVVVTTLNGTSTVSPGAQFSYVPDTAGAVVGLTSSANPSVVGQKVTFTAKVSAAIGTGPTPAGTVAFVDGPTTLAVATLNAEGVAKISANALGGGEHSVVARYSGDANYGRGESVPLVQVVDKAATELTLDSSRNPARYNSQTTLRANLAVLSPGKGTPTGTVTFFRNGSPVAAVPLEGKKFATYSLKGTPPGSYQFRAVYSGDGDGDYEASESSSLTQTITP
jgi:hypothetical protein